MSSNATLQQYFFTPNESYIRSSIYVSWAGHRSCEPNHHIGPRVLDSYKLIFILKGKGMVSIDGNAYQPLEQGDMVALFPKERHDYRADPNDPWELMWVCFSGDIAPYLVEELGLTSANFIRRNIVNSSIKKVLITLINTLGDRNDTNRLAATGQLYVLFACLKQTSAFAAAEQESSASPSCVASAARFIEENYYLELDVQTLCDYVNYSRSYLSRLFHQETGFTIPEYINKIRMENAMELLRDSNLPLQEVAASVGIRDSFYFSKLFKKHTGKTPREYRLASKTE